MIGGSGLPWCPEPPLTSPTTIEIRSTSSARPPRAVARRRWIWRRRWAADWLRRRTSPGGRGDLVGLGIVGGLFARPARPDARPSPLFVRAYLSRSESAFASQLATARRRADRAS